MRNFVSLLVFGLSIVSAQSSLAAVVSVQAQRLFAPVGFDSNDDVELVVAGTLPSTCYKMAPHQVRIDESQHRIIVNLFADLFSGVCIPVDATFANVIRVGTLTAGEWTIHVTGLDPAAFKVAVPGAQNRDDHLYAALDNVFVEKQGNDYVAHLTGRMLNSCMQWKEIRVLEQDRILVILPLVEMTESAATHSRCQPTISAFSQTVILPRTLSSGLYLVHARTMSGRAANAVFNVGD